MRTDPKQFREDDRSPAELAKAILDHEFSPPGDTSSRWTFREQWLCDGFSDDPDNKVHELTVGVVSALKLIEDGISLGMREKKDFSATLEVLHAYRQESLDLRPHNIKGSRVEGLSHTEEQMRDNADRAGGKSVEMMNCDRIEKLVRQLGRKLCIQLTEPGQGLNS
jgi:hypothetical protein